MCCEQLFGEVMFDPRDPQSPERVHAACFKRVTAKPADELVEVTVWVLLDGNGKAVADCDPDNLHDEYRIDFGDLDVRVATQLYRVTVRVPRPRAVPVVCDVSPA